MRSQIADPELREKVTPDYTIGCKRILLSNHWYRRSPSPTSSCSPAASREVRRTRSSTGDGEEREVDAIIFGTGFQVTDMPVARLVRGPRGQDARRALAGQPEGPPRHDHAGLPEPVPAARPQHRARAQLDGLHDRVAGGLRDGRAAPHGRATAPTPWRSARTPPSASTPTSTSACRARSGTRGCASWYLDGPAATRRCGRTGRGASAGAPRASTPRTSSSRSARPARRAGGRHERPRADHGRRAAASAPRPCASSRARGGRGRPRPRGRRWRRRARLRRHRRGLGRAAVGRGRSSASAASTCSINNAGVGIRRSAGRAPDARASVLEVNLIGPWRVTDAALPALRESRGRVVNDASGLAHLAVPFATAYCMSKRGWSPPRTRCASSSATRSTVNHRLPAAARRLQAATAAARARGPVCRRASRTAALALAGALVGRARLRGGRRIQPARRSCTSAPTAPTPACSERATRSCRRRLRALAAGSVFVALRHGLAPARRRASARAPEAESQSRRPRCPARELEISAADRRAGSSAGPEIARAAPHRPRHGSARDTCAHHANGGKQHEVASPRVLASAPHLVARCWPRATPLRVAVLQVPGGEVRQVVVGVEQRPAVSAAPRVAVDHSDRGEPASVGISSPLGLDEEGRADVLRRQHAEQLRQRLADAEVLPAAAPRATSRARRTPRRVVEA